MTDETLNTDRGRTDDRSMPILPSADPTASPWTSFVERFGVTAAVGLLAVVPTMAAAVADPSSVPESLPMLRLCALLIVVAGMAVLTYRGAAEPAPAPVAVPVRVGR